MIDALRLSFATLLPWAAGFALLRAALARSGNSNAWVEVGYGHFLGVLLLTLLLRAQDALGLRLGITFAAIVLSILTIAGVTLATRWRVRTPTPTTSVSSSYSPVLHWLAYAALLLIVLRVATLAVDVVMRPLFAWDAWSQWGTKAKVWSALRDIVPFIGYDQWLARNVPGYTDTAPNYPATIPLLQTWMTLALKRWDDALMNLPWLMAFIALGCGIYGQLRRLGVDRDWAVLATYLALSLPLLDTHVALAGYADLHVAAAYALGTLALVEWERSRQREALFLLASVAILLPLLKLPGIAWLGTLMLGAFIAYFGTTPARITAVAVAVLGVTIAAGLYLGSGKITPDAAETQYRVVESLVQHLFAFGSWNLLWYLFPLALIVGWRSLAELKATAMALGAGFAFLAWTFFFTQAGDWVVDYTTVNRALLHIAPAAATFAALLVSSALKRSSVPNQ
ncbi:MAG TPA: hypothetical protein VNG69_04765 [Casimicrobiaceae bacterium]|nr:hypothetical protein [Casimicrobiaceae bacterium]